MLFDIPYLLFVSEITFIFWIRFFISCGSRRVRSFHQLTADPRAPAGASDKHLFELHFFKAATKHLFKRTCIGFNAIDPYENLLRRGKSLCSRLLMILPG